MTKAKIRPIAICVLRQADQILVVEARDPVKEETFYRPPGGGIEFGETGAVAVAREIREEIAAEIDDLRYIGALENIFRYNGEVGHEIVLVYEARFVDDALYASSSIAGSESDGQPILLVWKALHEFSANRPLYPDGLLALIDASHGNL